MKTIHTHKGPMLMVEKPIKFSLIGDDIKVEQDLPNTMYKMVSRIMCPGYGVICCGCIYQEELKCVITGGPSYSCKYEESSGIQILQRSFVQKVLITKDANIMQEICEPKDKVFRVILPDGIDNYNDGEEWFIKHALGRFNSPKAIKTLSVPKYVT